MCLKNLLSEWNQNSNPFPVICCNVDIFSSLDLHDITMKFMLSWKLENKFMYTAQFYFHSFQAFVNPSILQSRVKWGDTAEGREILQFWRTSYDRNSTSFESNKKLLDCKYLMIDSSRGLPCYNVHWECSILFYSWNMSISCQYVIMKYVNMYMYLFKITSSNIF